MIVLNLASIDLCTGCWHKVTFCFQRRKRQHLIILQQPTQTVFPSRREAFRGALILLGERAITDGANGPYATSSRQRGFVGFGVSHLMRILAAAEASQRSSWYQKWNVHLFARPEVSIIWFILHALEGGDASRKNGTEGLG